VKANGGTLGVVVTASHNPASDNGIKFFAAGGLKLSDQDEARIEALLPTSPTPSPAGEPGVRQGVAGYVAEMASALPAGGLSGWRIVVDAAHGATAETSPAVLRRLGAEVHALGVEPNGININDGVGSEHPEALAAEVRARGARLGVAHDGDGDRCILCDETGAILDGDEILVILALDALARGDLAAGTLVVTVQSNLGVDAALVAAGGKVERTDVGDRHVLARLLELGARLGGESSGHIIDLNLSPTGDGLAAALGVLDVMRRSGRPLSELRRGLSKFPQGTRNLRIAGKRPIEECPRLAEELAALTRELGSAGRVMARFSGTEPKLRLLAEARDEARVAEALTRLERAAKCDLAVPL
jgi:phosphoglucosamine mutase